MADHVDADPFRVAYVCKKITLKKVKRILKIYKRKRRSSDKFDANGNVLPGYFIDIYI